MAQISKITLPSGTSYDLKDSVAREAIEHLNNYTEYLGVTSTALTDGASTNPITINGESVTARTGDIVNYGSKEFIFNGTVWQEFGDMQGLGDLAYKDSASGSYTPAGTVSAPTFSGSEGSVNVTGTPSGSITISKGTGTANYTPEGTVSTPTITVTPTTTTVNSITAVGTLPSCTLPTLSTTVANEVLTLSWTDGSFDAGTLPTKGANTTVATGIDSATSTQPTFSGTGAELKATFSGSSGTYQGTFTPSGSVSQPTFSGTAATVTVS